MLKKLSNSGVSVNQWVKLYYHLSKLHLQINIPSSLKRCIKHFQISHGHWNLWNGMIWLSGVTGWLSGFLWCEIIIRQTFSFLNKWQVLIYKISLGPTLLQILASSLTWALMPIISGFVMSRERELHCNVVLCVSASLCALSPASCLQYAFLLDLLQ